MIAAIPRLAFLTVMLLAAISVSAQVTLRDIRLHHHGDYTRIAVELDGKADYELRNFSDRHEMVLLEIKGVSGDIPRVQMPSGRSLVNAHATRHREETGVLGLHFRTTTQVRLEDQTLENPHRIVVDLYPAGGSTPAPREASSRSSGGWVRRIILDPGHGGHHKGGVGRLNGRTVYEKEVAMRVAERAERYFLSDPRFEARLTRRTDTYVGLYERTQIASRLTGDLFISIHANAVEGAAAQRRARGFEIFTWNPTANSAAAARAMERMEREEARAGGVTPDNNAILTSIMRDALMSQALESRIVAQAVHRVAVRDPYLRANDRGLHRARFRVLEIYDMPSILVEMGFMTHPEEVRLLFSADFQEKWARIMYEGVIEYYVQTDPEFPRTIAAANAQRGN